MTEKKGGSDVRTATQTTAEHIEKNGFSLNGLKWFTSAIDADVTFTLAKIRSPGVDVKENSPPSLFFLKLRNAYNTLNGIKPIRLKDKLGTRQVPTAELILEGCKAQIASPEGKGISLIMNLTNITRLHNILSAVSFMRKITFLVEDYSNKRKVFGKILKEQPLHLLTYSKLKFLTEGCVLLTLELGKLQGISEWARDKTNKIDMLRLLLPLAKLFTAKMSIFVCSEGMECIGGNGYMENSFIPNMLRDSFVLSIWEGTTNVLSLDFVRVYEHKKQVIDIFFKSVEKRLKRLY
jgi:alkylation response protein AidB-like acyl-CoA dehydrogenase